jgi:anti-anti-sigma factor
MDLVCSLALIGVTPVLQVSGEVDLATLPYFRDQLLRAVSVHRGTTLVVDLDGVIVLDDTGIGMLLGAAGQAREQGGDLVVVSNNERLLARFELTRLDQAIEVRSTIS